MKLKQAVREEAHLIILRFGIIFSFFGATATAMIFFGMKRISDLGRFLAAREAAENITLIAFVYILASLALYMDKRKREREEQ